MFGKNTKKGFILLVGILVAMVIFSVGVVMANIVFRELILSFTARESNKVFFSADTGLECAKYWDNARGDVRYESRFNTDSSDDTIECDDTLSEIETAGTIRYVWFDHLVQDTTNLCVNIEVEHCDVNDSDCIFEGAETGDNRSTVQSWAFNTCDTQKQRRVDRAIRAKYIGAR